VVEHRKPEVVNRRARGIHMVTGFDGVIAGFAEEYQRELIVIVLVAVADAAAVGDESSRSNI